MCKYINFIANFFGIFDDFLNFDSNFGTPHHFEKSPNMSNIRHISMIKKNLVQPTKNNSKDLPKPGTHVSSSQILH